MNCKKILLGLIFLGLVSAQVTTVQAMRRQGVFVSEDDLRNLGQRYFNAGRAAAQQRAGNAQPNIAAVPSLTGALMKTGLFAVGTYCLASLGNLFMGAANNGAYEWGLSAAQQNGAFAIASLCYLGGVVFGLNTAGWALTTSQLAINGYDDLQRQAVLQFNRVFNGAMNCFRGFVAPPLR